MVIYFSQRSSKFAKTIYTSYFASFRFLRVLIEHFLASFDPRHLNSHILRRSRCYSVNRLYYFFLFSMRDIRLHLTCAMLSHLSFQIV